MACMNTVQENSNPVEDLASQQSRVDDHSFKSSRNTELITLAIHLNTSLGVK